MQRKSKRFKENHRKSKTIYKNNRESAFVKAIKEKKLNYTWTHLSSNFNKLYDECSESEMANAREAGFNKTSANVLGSECNKACIWVPKKPKCISIIGSLYTAGKVLNLN